MFFINRKRNKRQDLRDAYYAVEQIHTAGTPREADMLTGYAIGVVDEKYHNGRLESSTTDAIAEMAEAIGEEVRRDLIEKRNGRKPEQEKSGILQIVEIAEIKEE